MKEHMEAALVWRANINTASQDVDSYQVALRQRVFGLGWSVENGASGMPWEEYAAKAAVEHGTHLSAWTRHMKFLRDSLADGDFVWIRDNNALYYVGVIDGPWTYRASSENVTADLVNVRKCNWSTPISSMNVPGTLRECRGLFRLIKGDDYQPALEHSRLMYYGSTEDSQSNMSRPQGTLFTWLAPCDCEDLVGLYLQQERGYSIIPNSCKQSTKKFEFTLIHSNTGKEAAAQVKRGQTNIQLDAYSGDPFRVFVLTTNGKYLGRCPANVEILDQSELVRFAQSRRRSLPLTIRGPVDRLYPEDLRLIG